MKSISIHFYLFIVFFVACHSNTPQNSPVVKELTLDDSSKTDIKEHRATDFVISLNQNFIPSKNMIYSPTLLFAWDEIKKKLGSDVMVSDSVNEYFDFLNTTKSFSDVMSKSEYSVDILENVDGFIAKASFEKRLPFKDKFAVLDDIYFKNNKVKGFGMEGSESFPAENIDIVYYKNDNEFIIKILLKDDEDEIILIKGDESSTNFKDVVSYYDKKTKEGRAFKKSKVSSWKTEFIEKDKLIVPNLKFNIEKTFSELHNVRFTDSKQKSHILIDCAQRNAFLLNEKGAIIESEMRAMVDSIGVKKVNYSKPKNLVFDNDFYILMKKKTAIYPYFALKIVNSELMIPNK